MKISNSVSSSYKVADSQRKIGSIADYDPLHYEYSNGNNKFNRQNYSTSAIPANTQHTQQQQQQQRSLSNLNYYQKQHETVDQDYSTQTNNINLNDIKTSVYKAIYDYDAKEDDEISFRDGDKFTNCELIDVGWMIGVHEKSGKHGMFPSNYVEPVDYF